ncbi:MAG TPA: helix-turn-helix transcriptional regulator [Syntrophomonas sp.]|jgi:transcriptional regulator with XRE-family HTH domain|nr:helix-turn-helix transcriptional regulator [Syntrophomonas sp.]
MDLGEAIAQRIAELCKEQGISINKLAVLSGLTQSTVDGILKGRSQNPKIATLMRISRGLNMTISEFLDDVRIIDADIEE